MWPADLYSLAPIVPGDRAAECGNRSTQRIRKPTIHSPGPVRPTTLLTAKTLHSYSVRNLRDHGLALAEYPGGYPGRRDSRPAEQAAWPSCVAQAT